jgi:proteasome accessory factor C
MSVPVADLAETLGTTPEQLADDLGALCLCGITPYTPDQMVDVFVEDGMVEVYSPLPALHAPVRLSPAEAEALAAALAAAGFTAGDPLAAKLLAAASADFDATALERTLRSALATHDSAIFETLASAVHGREVVAIAYQADGAAAPAEREIEPLQLFAERGAWYLSAWCRTAGGLRTFRIDRIRTAEPTAENFSRAASADAAASPTGAPSAFAPEGLPLAMLRFYADEPFVAREWPSGRVVGTDADGSTFAEVPFAGTGWIARRVAARLGKVEVTAPEAVRAAVRALARGDGA